MFYIVEVCSAGSEKFEKRTISEICFRRMMENGRGFNYNLPPGNPRPNKEWSLG